MTNQQEEEKEVNKQKLLYPPKSLTDNELKNHIYANVSQNNPEFLALLAQANGLSTQDEIKEALYITQIAAVESSCINSSLNENAMETYKELEKLCFFNNDDYEYINAVEGKNAQTSLPVYIEERLTNISELKPLFGFVESINEAFLYTNNEVPTFNTYKANELCEKFESFEDSLENEQKSKLFFIASKMYRKISSKANPYTELKASPKEEELLGNVLRSTKDYKMINYCQNRFSKNRANNKDVINAYKNALKGTKDRKDLYKINSNLADIYKENSRTVGYITPHGDKHRDAEKSKKYLFEAYRYSSKDDKVSVLKRIAEIQLQTHDDEGWKNTKTVIALKHLKGEERCYALNNIAEKTKDFSYFEKSMEECLKAKMSKNSKRNVLDDTHSKLSKYSANDNAKKLKADCEKYLTSFEDCKPNIIDLISRKKSR